MEHLTHGNGKYSRLVSRQGLIRVSSIVSSWFSVCHELEMYNGVMGIASGFAAVGEFMQAQ